MNDEIDPLDAAEREVIEQIELIRRAYQRDIDPLVQRLANIRASRPLNRFFIFGQLCDPKTWPVDSPCKPD